MVAAGLVVLIIEGVVNIRLPYQLEFGEGNVLASAMLVARGESAYPPLTAQPPYVFSPYGPLLYWIEAPLLRWFGAGFAAGRTLSLLATLAAAAFIVLLLRRWTGAWRPALLFGALYPCMPEVGLWATMLRADALAAAFSLAGLYVVADESRVRRWPVAALLFLAAILVKPTLVAAPAAFFLYLLFRKQHRTALAFSATMAAALVVAILWMQHATAGAFVTHLAGSHPEPYTLRHYFLLAQLVLREQLLPTAMLVAFVAVSVKRKLVTLPLLYIAMALLSTLSGGIAGASANHFLAWSAAVCIGAGMAYHWAETRVGRFARPLRATAMLAIVASVLVYSLLSWAAWDDTVPGPLEAAGELLPYQARVFPIDTDVPRGCIEMQDYLASIPGKLVVSENTGAALLTGKTLLITDPYSYGQLVLAGKLPGKPLEDMLRERRVAAVVLARDVARLRLQKTDRWSPALLDAVEQNYRLEGSFLCSNGSAVYVPK